MDNSPKPTKHQSTALEYVLNAVDAETSLSVTGMAGCGKTQLVKYISDAMPKVYLTAMTNKAAAVLSEKTGKECRTLHSLLRLAPKIDYKTGRQLLKRIDNKVPQRGSVILVDEAFMLDSDFIEYIKDYIMIFVGDPYQLPPINEPESFVNSVEGTKLTEVLRHDSDILDLSTRLCLNVRDGTDFAGYEPTPNVSKFTSPHKFNCQFFDAIKNGEDAIYLAWTNNTCKSIIRQTRRALKKHEVIPCVGDKMVANSIVVDFDDESIILLSNNSEVTILAVEESKTVINDETIEAMSLLCKYGDNTVGVTICLDDAKYANVLSTALAKAKKDSYYWRAYYQAKRAFADMRFTYACTVHKSQGSTFDSVYVNDRDINKCRESELKKRLRYVACSRSAKSLHILS